MSRTTISSREFNQDVSKAKRNTEKGPVYITDRGQVSHVLLTIEAYQKLTGSQQNIVDLLAMQDSDKVTFKAPKLDKKIIKPVEFN